ncbi:MAG: histidine kinase dimerization/phospho-acceptor domain-containing protein, partial [Acidimicrobiia bacterium]
MSLRRRVLIGGLLVVLAVLVADLVVALTVRSYLLDQLDTQLERRAVAVNRVGFPPFGPPPFLDGPDASKGEAEQRPLSDFYVELRDAEGTVVRRFQPGLDAAVAGPRLETAATLARASAPGEPLSPFTVSAAVGTNSWRAAATRHDDGSISVTALSMAASQATTRRVVVVEVCATLAVIAAVTAVALWILRQGVRPLAAMTATAGAIAAGDLTRRVAHDDPRTEAGELGIALNQMLTQIEDAFSERESSEGRLRQFVADASHELRTPLTSIQGYTDLYDTGALASEERLADAMRRMQGEATRMGIMVDDLLLLAGLDQGRPLELAPVRLDLLAADATADARAVEPDRPITLAAEV